MSWGVDIEVDHGDGYATVIEVVDGHTYNLTPMWRRAGVVSEGSRDLDGRNAGEMRGVLAQAVADARANEAAYRELDPPNGWGDYDGFLEILMRLERLCREHPTGTLRWNG